MATLQGTAKSIFLTEFVSAFFLGMRYFFQPKATVNYPFEKNPISPRSEMLCPKLGPRENPIGKSNQPVKKQAPSGMLSCLALSTAAMSSSLVKCNESMKVCML